MQKGFDIGIRIWGWSALTSLGCCGARSRSRQQTCAVHAFFLGTREAGPKGVVGLPRLERGPWERRIWVRDCVMASFEARASEPPELNEVTFTRLTFDRPETVPLYPARALADGKLLRLPLCYVNTRP